MTTPAAPPALPTTRQCGRCRQTFPLDGSVEPSDSGIWWACPACRSVLFGSELGRRRAEPTIEPANEPASEQVAP